MFRSRRFALAALLENSHPRAVMKSQLFPRTCCRPLLFALTALALVLSGCVTRDVNPLQARAHKGYVDFYEESVGELSWQVDRFDEKAQAFRTVFSELEARPERILRLELPPGHHRLRVLFMNCFIREPAQVEVDVQEGRVTPVEVTVTPDGTTDVLRKEVRLGSTAGGRYGRSAKYTSSESGLYRVSARAQAAQSYAVKDRMPYARLPDLKP